MGGVDSAEAAFPRPFTQRREVTRVAERVAEHCGAPSSAYVETMELLKSPPPAAPLVSAIVGSCLDLQAGLLGTQYFAPTVQFKLTTFW